MSRPRTITVLAIASLLALTGCGSPEPTFDPGSVAEAPVEAPIEAPVDADPADEPAAIHVQVNEDGTRTYENQKALLTVTEELSSPGDEAFFGDTALAKGLDVLADGHHLSLRIHRQASPITGAELVAVAETVLTNIGW